MHCLLVQFHTPLCQARTSLQAVTQPIDNRLLSYVISELCQIYQGLNKWLDSAIIYSYCSITTTVFITNCRNR